MLCCIECNALGNDKELHVCVLIQMCNAQEMLSEDESWNLEDSINGGKKVNGIAKYVPVNVHFSQFKRKRFLERIFVSWVGQAFGELMDEWMDAHCPYICMFK